MAAEGHKKGSERTSFEYVMSKMSGGPHNLGDPDDRFMRKVEHLLVDNMMRERSWEMCTEERKEFDKCIGGEGNMFPFRCRPQMKKMRACQLELYESDEFRKKITEEYLKIRAEYRRTGMTKNDQKIHEEKMEDYQKWLQEKQKHTFGASQANT